MKGKNDKKRPAPFSIRLSFEERARLERQAAGMPIGAYVKARVFDGNAPTRRQSAYTMQDREALCQVLAKLGASRLANNMNQLAHAANTGSLPVTEDIAKELSDACADIRAMRLLLMTALGAREPRP